LFTQRLPYGKELLAKTAALPRAPSALQPRLNADHDAVILKAIHPERSQRYASVQEFDEDWRRVRSGLLPTARRVTRLHRLRRWIHGNRLLAGGLLLTLLAVVSAGFAIALALAPIPGDEQTVLLDTLPTGASIAFVPLDSRTGEPLPERIIHASVTWRAASRRETTSSWPIWRTAAAGFRVYWHVPDSEEVK
jgi:hypothetical protein